jgi:hypothetical protein
MSEHRFYVYVIMREHPVTGDAVPIYVGKGQGRRAYVHEESAKRIMSLPKDERSVAVRRCHNPHLIWAIIKAGGSLPMVKVEVGLTEIEAFELERIWVIRFGREQFGGTLYNRTNGGDGSSGVLFSEERRRAISERVMVQWSSVDRRDQMSIRMLGENNPMFGKPSPNLGKPCSEEQKAKISTAQIGELNHRYGKPANNRGKPMSEEQKAKLSAAHKGKMTGENNPNFGKPAHNRGKPMSEEQKAKISAANSGENNPMFGKPAHNRGKPMSEEQKAKLRGRILSEEHRENLRVAWVRRKQSLG